MNFLSFSFLWDLPLHMQTKTRIINTLDKILCFPFLFLGLSSTTWHPHVAPELMVAGWSRGGIVLSVVAYRTQAMEKSQSAKCLVWIFRVLSGKFINTFQQQISAPTTRDSMVWHSHPTLLYRPRRTPCMGYLVGLVHRPFKEPLYDSRDIFHFWANKD